jgi:hypothetical protein
MRLPRRDDLDPTGEGRVNAGSARREACLSHRIVIVSKEDREPTTSQVNKAGKTLRRFMRGVDYTEEQVRGAILVMDAFRASHQAPMNAASMGLRSIVRTVGCKDPEVSQRLKRSESVITKLQYQPTLALSRMQDLGGCRAVLDSVDEVRRVQTRIERNRPVLALSDYIEHPKKSGYRGVHIVVEYGSDRGRYRARPVEIQLRTRVMHEWALTVERMSTTLGADLKRGQGPQEILELLGVTSEILAMQEFGEVVTEGMLARLGAAQAAFQRYLRRE